MELLNTYLEQGQKLIESLSLSSYPVAIKYMTSEDKLPEGAIQPNKLGKRMSICQAFTLARQHGSVVSITASDNFCVPATVIHRWADIPLSELIESQVRQEWHKNREVEVARHETLLKTLGKDVFSAPIKYKGLVCAPLNNTPFVPDSILVYCDGMQITHIIQALSYEHKYTPVSLFEGFEESCVKGGWIPFLSKKPQVVIPGMGDRSFAAIQTHELGIGFHGELLFYVMENLFKTGGRMNIGHPQKTMFPMELTEELTPGFKYLWDKIHSTE